MYLILVYQTRLCDEVFHYELGNGTAADIAVTDEENFYHVEVLLTWDFGTRDYGIILLTSLRAQTRNLPSERGIVFAHGRWRMFLRHDGKRR